MQIERIGAQNVVNQFVKVMTAKAILIIALAMGFAMSSWAHSSFMQGDKSFLMDGLAESIASDDSWQEEGGEEEGGITNLVRSTAPSDCHCNQGMSEITMQYVGTAWSVMIDAYEDPGSMGHIVHYPFVLKDSLFKVNGLALPNGLLDIDTYIITNGIAATELGIHTSCSQSILGTVHGDYKVVAYRDEFGNECAIDIHEDEADESLSANFFKSQELDVIVYPNPTNGQFNVVFNGFNMAIPIQITITDSQGRPLTTTTYTGPRNSTSLDISHLPSGTYFIRVTSGDNTITERIMKL